MKNMKIKLVTERDENVPVTHNETLDLNISKHSSFLLNSRHTSVKKSFLQNIQTVAKL